jgi:hypothetical protein
MAFLLHFKDDCTEKIMLAFFLCMIFYQSYCVIFSYILFTFPQTSKCFLWNGTNKMHILASGPELLAVRFGYVIFGEKKGRILKSFHCAAVCRTTEEGENSTGLKLVKQSEMAPYFLLVHSFWPGPIENGVHPKWPQQWIECGSIPMPAVCPC